MPCLYPSLARAFGQKGCLSIGVAAVLLFNLCLPNLRWLRSEGGGAGFDAPQQAAAAHPRPDHGGGMIWSGLLLANALRGVAGPLVFPAMIIIVNAAVSADLGFWNGMMSSVAAVARAASPLVFGYLFALGTREGHAPFPRDVSMPFLLSFVTLLASIALVWAVPTAAAATDEQSARFASRVQPVTRRRWWRGVTRRLAHAGRPPPRGRPSASEAGV